MSLLKIENLHARVEEKEILKGFNLTVNAGEVHAIMGPNGAGKSTLASVLAGNSNFEVTAGSALLDGVDLLEMAPEERAREGVFLAFQYPVEIPGVSNTNFLRCRIRRSAQAPWSARAGCQGIPRLHKGEEGNGGTDR
jgi:Fe-S cluster assembly ATP-binding protein